VVTIGISSLLVTPDNYGYMGPIKAALESSVPLPREIVQRGFRGALQRRSGAGPLKTSASAGIPGYLESYLYAEKLTFRKRNLSTPRWPMPRVVFLLSERSSGHERHDPRRGRRPRQQYLRQGDRPARDADGAVTRAACAFSHVCIEALAVALPEEIWTSAEIETRLRPLYDRLKLPLGRLELMTGIRERRVWPAGTRPSDASAAAGRAVLAKSALGRSRWSCLSTAR
jgi:hypothetical protein